MGLNRYYTPDALQTGTYLLTGTEAHHLLRVMRAQKGDQLELINGKGALALATVQEIHKKETSLTIEKVENFPPEEPPVILAAALIKQSRLEWLIEKGTEVGAHSFWLFASDHSERKDLSKNHLLRLEAATISALKQCKRLHLPEIKIFSKLPSPEGRAFFGDLSPNAPLLMRTKERTTLYIGPEGGFSEREEQQLQNMAAVGVRLGRHTLRAETAGLSALIRILL